MRLLLDTSVLIMADSGRLKNQQADIVTNEANENFVSSISVWEILQKAKIGKLPVYFTQSNFIKGIMKDLNAEFLPFEVEDAFELESLPHIHKDPFDRMLICQAITNGMAIVTDDKEIAKYPIRIIW